MSETIKSARLGEQYTKIEHRSGLTLLLYPMEGYSTAYALFATKYGSIDTCFKTNKDKDFVQVPEGIAHFLEHKMFENEDGDAFAKYAKTGASANAYTTFDKTAYLFACSENFAESLEILLDFVSKPYFTDETVKKEQGIIGQEITMYDDNPDWKVFFNLLGALYQKHPLRLEIAGTVQSIAEIDADLLYRCYHTFYNLNNMVLCISGNFEVQTVLDLADKLLTKSEDITIEAAPVEEPREVNQQKAIQHLPVATPIFNIGFKGISTDFVDNIKNQVLDEILVDIIAGESTTLYRKLYDEGIINSTFMGEVLAGRDYTCTIFQGESKDPEKVYQALCEEITRIKEQGIDPEMFEICKRSVYGNYVGIFGRVEAVAGLMLTCHFAGFHPYDLPEVVANCTIEQLTKRLESSFDVRYSAISIVCQS